MKSNICSISKGGSGLETILSEVEKVCAYNGLEKKEALRLRLLAEELTGMLSELVQNFDGYFWLENSGRSYELHTEFSVEGLSREKKQALLAVSAKKKNAAASGFMGKIRDITENFLLSFEEPTANNYYASEYLHGYDVADVSYSYAWTLEHYIAQQKEKTSQSEEEWDQLEKSIVAKLADDVIVGIRGLKVEIVIKKEF